MKKTLYLLVGIVDHLVKFRELFLDIWALGRYRELIQEVIIILSHR